MPAPIRIDNWVTVEFVCVLDGQIVETVFTYQSNTMAISEADILAFANLWLTTMQPILVNALSNSVRLSKVIAKTHFKTFPNVGAEVLFPINTLGGIASQ